MDATWFWRLIGLGVPKQERKRIVFWVAFWVSVKVNLEHILYDLEAIVVRQVIEYA